MAEPRPPGDPCNTVALAASRRSWLSFPCRNRRVGKPHSQAATLLQGGIVGGRVRGPVLLLWNVVATLGVGFERHDNPLQTVTGKPHTILSQVTLSWSMHHTLSVVKGAKLRALFHMAGFIGQDVPLFEIREAGGNGTDLLISDNALGRALAEKFDHADIALMRGHGSTVVAPSIPLAVYRAVYAELNARYQIEATRMGEVTYLTEAEGRAAVDRVEGQVQRPWDLWKAQAAERREV